MRPIKTKELIKKLDKEGFKLSHRQGSHMTYKNPVSGKIAVLVDVKEQAPGTIRRIQDMSGLKF